MRLLKPKIGLEIHAQLATELKLFSNAKVDWKAPINSQVALFDCATPGTFPQLNMKCVDLAVKAARATRCTIERQILFDRKHYDHWDLPPGYQITQKRKPIGLNGEIRLESGKRIGIKQIHLEQDSGKSFNHNGKVIVDLNRAGVGLIEIVSKPEISSPKEAAQFVDIIHDMLQFLNICNGHMEQGVMRIDVNVNLVEKESELPVTPRVELKNINGINIIEAAIESELKRQEATLSTNPSELKQETRLYDPVTDKTILLRVKGTSEQYRYLPEYDLPTYDLEGISEAPLDYMTRYERIRNYQNQFPNLSTDFLLRLWTLPEILPNLFEKCFVKVSDQQFLLNWCVGELLAILNRENIKRIHFTPEAFSELVENVKNGLIDKEIAKSEIASALKQSRNLNVPIFNKNSLNLADLHAEIHKLFQLHSDRIEFLKSAEGQKRGSVDFFIGPLMKKFRGKISPVELAKILKDLINKD